MSRKPLSQEDVSTHEYELLPLRIHLLDRDRAVVTNLVGEHLTVSTTELENLVDGQPIDPVFESSLRSRHMIRSSGETLPLELLAMKIATKKSRLSDFTALHIFVVTLRCEHTCRYCQVSRQASGHGEFDMTEETAEHALRHVFSSPSHQIKIEFQGGEPLLNFDLVKWIVFRALEINTVEKRDLAFVITTNLALINEEAVSFCKEYSISISTSLDGPRELHNSNRRRPGQDSWDKAVDGIKVILNELGPGMVSALMTTSEASLEQPEAIIDTYVEIGLQSIFLRPISPYGFATRLRGGGQYDTARWLEFYRRGLDHVIELNRRGIPMVEIYTSIVSKKIHTNVDPGYVDLMSPSGIGIGGIVYNYDGGIYASDEGRMLAEMGDETFRLGEVIDEYGKVMQSEKLLIPLFESFTLSVPKCDLCAFEPWCGADPVFHYTTSGDFAGHKTFSAFCERNTGIYTHVLQLMEDEFSANLFRTWAFS